MAADAAAQADWLTELALALPPALREIVAHRIWESLHPDESLPLDPDQLDEIQRRVAEMDAGRVKVLDGDEAVRSARARIEARRR